MSNTVRETVTPSDTIDFDEAVHFEVIVTHCHPAACGWLGSNTRHRHRAAFAGDGRPT